MIAQCIVTLWLSAQLLLMVDCAAIASCTMDGCPAEVRPVCGSDGLTYMSECLAACQNVPVASTGSCEPVPQSGAGGRAAVHIPAAVFAQTDAGDQAAPAAARVLSRAVITAYHAEGMRMVGVMHSKAFAPSTPLLTEEDIGAMANNTAASSPGVVMMVNAHGHLYAVAPGLTPHTPAAAVQDILLSRARTDPHSPSEATAPVLLKADDSVFIDTMSMVDSAGRPETNQHAIIGSNSWGQAYKAPGRTLQGVFGEDTRQELQVPPKYPLSSAGHLMFVSSEDGQMFQCSGTLIGTYAVLTAAHCVVTRSGAVQRNIRFTAAETSRNHAGLGAANGVRVFFNSGYLSSTLDWTQWDMGVVVLDRPLGVNSTHAFAAEAQQLEASVSVHRPRRGRSPDTRQPRPDTHLLPSSSTPGTVGYAAQPRLDNTVVISAGYPGDKPLGSAWMMTCSLTDDHPDSNVVMNKCPITSGQSGAGLIERRLVNGSPHFYVRAIVSFEMCKSVCSGACCGGKAAFNGVLKITPYFQSFIDQHRDIRPDADESGFE